VKRRAQSLSERRQELVERSMTQRAALVANARPLLSKAAAADRIVGMLRRYGRSGHAADGGHGGADDDPVNLLAQLVVFFRDFFKAVISIIGFLMLLKFAFGFNISSVLTGLSIVGAAIALALRESLENLIASFIIFFDKPFTLGDLVKVQNITGHVEKIGLRSTRIRTDQKTFVTVPNKQMVDSILDNLTLRTQLKGELRLQIDLSATSSELERLISGVKKILQHPSVENFTVSLNDIAVNAFLVNADYFTSPLTQLEYLAVKEEINLQVLKLLEELKIEMAGARTDIRIEGAINGKQD
jgi:MscS family membrane protein